MKILTIDQAHNAEFTRIRLELNRSFIRQHLESNPERSLYAWRTIDALDAAVAILKDDLADYAVRSQGSLVP